MRKAFAPLQICSNCGQILSEENVILGIEDYGEDPEDISEDELDHLSFCCPGYSDESGCPGYSREDKSLAAYWIRR